MLLSYAATSSVKRLNRDLNQQSHDRYSGGLTHYPIKILYGADLRFKYILKYIPVFFLF